MQMSVRERSGARPWACLMVVGTGVSGVAAQPATFQGVPHSTPGVRVYATGLSADGQKVVGYTVDAGDVRRGFWWTPGSGVEIVPDACAAAPDTEIAAVSGDGSVLVGSMIFCGIDPFCPPCLTVGAGVWSEGAGAVSLGMFPGGEYIGDTFSGAAAASFDGSVVVGVSPGWDIEFEEEPYFRSFRWTAAGGLADLGAIAQSTYAAATGVSADGSVVVVDSHMRLAGNISTYHGFVWVDGEGYTPVPFAGLAPDLESMRARAVSADGTTVVGSVATRVVFPTGRSEAFRWRRGEAQAELLATLPGQGLVNARASGVTADGSLVVGELSGSGQSHPALWDDVHGARLLADVLTQGGADLSGWTLREITGISADGGVLVGNGIRQDPVNGPVFDAWIATIGAPTPPQCPADWNGDEQVNSTDLSAFITSWLDSVQNSNLIADFNGDGAVNSTDLSAFITAWLHAVQNGC